MRAVIIFIILVALVSCKDTKSEIKNKEYLDAISVNSTDLEVNREYLQFLFFESSRSEAVEYYESNKDIFENDIISNCIYGAALCSAGGQEKNIIDKLLLLKKGMNILNQSIEIATDYNPYLWRIQTYSNFPEIMNVRSIIETDIITIQQKYTLPPRALIQVYDAQLNMVQIYKDVELLDEVIKSINETLPIDKQKSLVERSVLIQKEIGV